MFVGKRDWSLKERFSAGEKNIIDLNHYSRWQKFKSELSEEDKTKWDNLVKKIQKDKDGKRFLSTPLSKEEIAWATDLLRRAEEQGL